MKGAERLSWSISGYGPYARKAKDRKSPCRAQYAPDDYRLVGRISGEPPSRERSSITDGRRNGSKLPRLVTTSADRLPAIAPAEVEIR